MHEKYSDPSALVYRHQELLYRLALLVAGDAESAAKLVERAYRALPPEPGDAEARLIRALSPGGSKHQRWAYTGHENPAYVPLDAPRVAALLDALAGIPAAARFVVGLHYLHGLTAGEVAALLGEAAGSSTPAKVLARFRIDAARALGLVPAEVDDALLVELDAMADGLLSEEQAVLLRRAVFEQPGLRAARDGLAQARDLLARTLLALFAVAPPLALTEQLLEIVQKRQRSRVRRGLIWAQGALALGVLGLVAAIVLAPSLLGRRAAPTLSRAPSAAELIDSAIHRFDRAQLQAGVLHEQYRVAVGGEASPYLIERWYDYAAPHRVRVTVKAEGAAGADGRTVMEIGSDGRSLVQYRSADGAAFRSRSSVDVHVSEAEAEAALPLLRSEPSTGYFLRGLRGDFIDIAPLYLAQARASGATFLGRTQALGRQAFLLTYRTSRLPTQSPGQEAPAEQTLQVMLTIDAQTYALLGVAVVPDSGAESRTLHPLQALAFDIAADVPDDRFKLPASGRVVQHTGLASVRALDLPSELFISLDEARRRMPVQLLAPQRLPARQ
jgi:DNA-directed RNA polymerase specialized sigma24 family protein